MSESIDLKPILTKLSQPGRFLVVFPNQASVDHVAAALSLYLSLKEQDKDVKIASGAQIRAEFSRLVGLDEISDSISNRDLVIGFENYAFEAIEKVSHNEGANNKFELIIQPKTGKSAPNPDEVKFSFRGADADMIFLVGVNRLEDLGDLYQSEQNLFTKADTISFSRRQNPPFASVSVVDDQASSLSEIMADFLERLNMPAKEDVASNLLAGIDFATNRFQNPMISASAFMMAGKLLEAGAKRLPPRPGNNQPGFPGMAGQPGGFLPFVPPSNVNRLPNMNGQSPAPRPMPGGSSLDQSSDNSSDSNDDQPPQDWLKPKIYQGAGRLQ